MHAPPAPPTPIVASTKGDASIPPHDPRPSHGSASNEALAAPPEAESKPSTKLTKPTPTPPVQTPNNVESHAAGATAAPQQAKPVFTPSTALPAKDEPKQVDGMVNGVASDDVPPERRAAQVSFPPGTKGSPSEESPDSVAAKGPEGLAIVENGVADKTGRNQDLSIKVPPHAASKIPDALSSPGSTAPSATTPGNHDVSADTSPEHDAPHYIHDRMEEDAEDKDEQGEEAEDATETETGTESAKPEPDASDSKSTSLDEDQLLQESIRSSAAATSPEPIKTHDRPEVKTDAATVAQETSPATPQKIEPQPATTIDAQPPSTLAKTASEVPDSQEETPERMDVDAAQATEPASIVSPVAQAPGGAPKAATNATPVTVKPTPPREPLPAPERAVTRVSSGAMRLKSVSEIVGESPRSSSATERNTTKAPQNQLTPVTSTPQSPPSRPKNTARRDRTKAQVSTVLFGKQPKQMEEKALVPGQKETIQASDDYYTPLFIQNFTGATNWMQPIEKILFHANKTIATPDAYLAIQDHQACKVLRRVYHLQQHDKWSLRQPKRCPEPTRPPSHWDVLFQEMKWMRTDFREERKWKMAVAKNIAYACAEWVESTPEERKALQVPALIPPLRTDDVTMGDAADADSAENHPTPDLVTEDADSPQILDHLSEDFPETVAPSAIFALQEDDVVFALRRTPASDKLLEELPLYGAPLKVPRFELTGPEYDPDAHWRRPALPLSKYVEGEMKLLADGPPRKRSRYSYHNEESDDEKDSAFDAGTLAHNVRLPPRSSEVALFTPESKHIRDRLHAGHQFRPPSEHPMPLQSFYESRSPSQWTVVEDDELRSLVREHSYNWSLISNLLSTKSLFASGAERRTPWECFERWINLEGLPADMQKTQYFKAYNSRIDAAQRVIAQQNQLAAQRASQEGGAVTPIRRRQSTPLRVERRRNQKHLTLIDAMRKLAKKRETTIQKQQHSAAQNAAKKVNDTMAQRPIKTPRDYSLLRWERDQALAEKMAQYAQRQEAQRRVSNPFFCYCGPARVNMSRPGHAPGQSPSPVRPVGRGTRCSTTGWSESRPSCSSCQRGEWRHQPRGRPQSARSGSRCGRCSSSGPRTHAHAGSCEWNRWYCWCSGSDGR